MNGGVHKWSRKPLQIIPKPLRAVILSRARGEESGFETLRFAQGDKTDRFRDRF